MFMKENSLYIVWEKEKMEVHLDPKTFKLKALREIVRYQIFNADETEIFIKQSNGKHPISRRDLIKARKLSGEDLRIYLDTAAENLYQSNELIFKVVGNRVFKSPLGHKERLSPPGQFMEFIENHPNLSYLDNISGNKK